MLAVGPTPGPQTPIHWWPRREVCRHCDVSVTPRGDTLEDWSPMFERLAGKVDTLMALALPLMVIGTWLALAH